MKKLFFLITIFISLALVACGDGGEVVDQARATAESVAQGVSDTAEEISEVAEDAISNLDEDEVAGATMVTCDAADIPSPTAGLVNVRFVNNSGEEMTLIWHDQEQEPPQLVEYSRIGSGESFDQPTYTGHEWLLRDAEGELLKIYTASDAATQCAVVYPHFGYEGEGGPVNWAELSAHYEMCGRGQSQSPIDLTNAALTDLDNIVFSYGDTAVNILNNGHTIQVNNSSDSQIIIGDIPYKLLQFHFHAPSEHAVDGEPFPIEMHLVHRSADGKLAVVGVMIKEGAENSAFAPVWSNLPAEENGSIATGATVEVASLLPTNPTIYRYSGSLTTPPCSEDVIWSVMSTPVEMSAEQIAVFTAIIEGNNRPLQPINDRNLQLDETP